MSLNAPNQSVQDESPNVPGFCMKKHLFQSSRTLSGMLIWRTQRLRSRYNQRSSKHSTHKHNQEQKTNSDHGSQDMTMLSNTHAYLHIIPPSSMHALKVPPPISFTEHGISKRTSPEKAKHRVPMPSPSSTFCVEYDHFS